jgi:inhibitor of cysteine peptidase
MLRTQFGITFIIICLIIGLIPMTVYSMPSGTNSKIITENDNGKVISIKNGDTFYLRLNASPGAGYLWKPDLSNGLSLLETNYHLPEHMKQNESHLYGGITVQEFKIKAVMQGNQQVRGIYKKSWEKETGKEQKFSLNVEVV